MGDFFDKIFTWLGGVVRDLVTWIVDSIENISNESKIRRLIFRDELARLMENDFFFLGYSVWALTIGILGAGLAPAMAAWWTWVSTAGWVAEIAIKLDIATWLLRIEQLRLISQIAAIIFPEYRSISKDVMSAFAGISKIIYKDTEFISGVMQQSRRVLYNAYVLSGHDPETSEVLSYLDADPWITKLNERYRRYVENPYLVWDDFEDQVVKPALALFSEENLKRMAKYEEAHTLAVETVDNLQALTESVQAWVDVHPDQIKAVMDNKIGDALIKINEGIAYVERNIIETAGEILDLLTENMAKSMARIEIVAASIPELQVLIYDYYSLDPSDREDSLAMLRKLINQDLVIAKNQIRTGIQEKYDDYKAGLSELYRQGFTALADDKPLPITGGATPVPATPKGSWFVGEY